MTSRNKREERGVAVVELSLSMLFLIPLLLGVFIFGFKLIRSLEMTQIVRDIGHMYLRGIDFRNPGPQSNAQTLASDFNLTSGGTSEILLSQIKIIQQTDCDAVNTLHIGVPCANLNKPVFLQLVKIGNTSSGTSAFGAPPLQTDSTVSAYDEVNTSGAVAVNFSSAMVLKAGEVAYVAEMINQTPDLNIPGLSGSPLVYARCIF
jgi:hypothetical protein